MFKRNKTYFRFLGLIILIIGLFAFTSKRNAARKVLGVTIEFVGEQNIYVTESMVNKLLIQNQGRVTNVGEETLVLNKVEEKLDAHKMIAESDVYLSVNGRLKAKIIQRTPIARVQAKQSFYIDETGNTMPLSDNFSARVPLVSNVTEKDVNAVFPLVKKIREDDFLKKHVVGVFQNNKSEFVLQLRENDFTVNFGKTVNINRKVGNFKAFYQKALRDNSLGKYKSVSLKYSNQVVCTKK